MNEEFLLQAIGHIDEDLIVQAEEYRPVRRSAAWRRPLAGLAACLAVVLALRWGMDHLRMGSSGGASGNSMSSGNGEAAQENQTTESMEDDAHSGDWRGAIWVDGQLYWSTGQAVPGEVDESAILGVTTYTDGLPREEGQANIARDGARYAAVDGGIAVELNGTWILFVPDSEG